MGKKLIIKAELQDFAKKVLTFARLLQFLQPNPQISALKNLTTQPTLKSKMKNHLSSASLERAKTVFASRSQIAPLDRSWAALFGPVGSRLMTPIAVSFGVVAAGVSLNSARAATFTKANNTTNLGSAGSYVSGTSPGSSDTVLFDSTITGPLAVNQGGSAGTNLTFGSIQVTTLGGAVTITQNGSSNVLTLNTGGIDMSAATADLTFAVGTSGGSVRIASGDYAPNLSVAAGRTLTLDSFYNQGNTKTATLTGPGNIIFSNGSGSGGAMSYNITGSANVTMNGADGWSSGTLTSGTLNVGNDSAVNSSLNLNGGTLTASGFAHAIPSTVTLGGAAALGGTNALTFNGALTQSTSGTLTNNNTAAATAFAGGINISNSSTTRTLTLAGAGNITVSSLIANGSTATSGNLTYAGSGVLTLSASSTYSGATTLTSGTVIANDNAALGTSTITFNGGVLVAGGTAGAFANNVAFASAGGLIGVIGGSNNVTLSGTLSSNSNTLTLANSGSTTISGPVAISTSSTTQTLTVNGASNVTVSGVIGNGGTATAGNLIYSGGGVLTLSGSNTFSGTTTVGSGTLQIANGNALQNSTVAIPTNNALVIGSGVTAVAFGGLSGSNNLALANAGGSAFSLAVGGNGGTTAYSGALSGSGSFTKNGAGTLTLTGSNSYTGTTTISAGTLQIGDGVTDGSIEATSGITDNGTLGYNLLGSQTYGGVISGTGGLTKSGGGTLILSASNTFSGTTAISGGTLQITNGYALQNSTVAVPATNGLVIGSGITAATFGGLSGSGSLVLGNADGNPVSLNFGGNSASTSYSGFLSGSGSLTKAGSGTINLTGSNAYTGGTVISGGRIYLTDANSNQYALGSGTIALNSGTLQLFSNGAGSTSAGTVNNTIQVNAGTVGTLIAWGRGELNSNLIGSGTFDYQTDYIRADVNGNWSAFTGQINVTNGSNGGDFRINNTYGFGTAKVNLGAVDLYMNVNFASTLTNTIGELSGGTTSYLSGGPTAGRTMTWNVGGANTNATFAGTITNGGGPTAITKSGTGTWTLSGSNSYTGATTISSGALQLGNANALVNTLVAVSINNSLTFSPGIGAFNVGSLSGSGAVVLSDTAGGAVTLSVGGNNSSTAYSGNLSGAGGLAKAGTGTFALSGSHSYAGTTAVNAGMLSLSAATLGGNGAITVNSGTLSLASSTISGTGAVSINGGGFLTGGGVIAGPVTVAGGTTSIAQGTISLIDGTLGTLSLGGLTVGDPVAGTALLQFDAGGNGSDLIALGTNALTVNTGGAVVKINNLGGLAPGQTLSLVTYTNGVAPTGITLDPTTTHLGFNTASLVISATALQLSITGPAVPTTAYFAGTYNSVWNGSDGGTNANFTTDAAGTVNTNQVPGAITSVYLGANGSTTATTTLGTNFSIHSLNFTAGANASVSGSNTLTIGSGGIAVDGSSAGAAISNSSLVLGANQTWTNNSATIPLTVSVAVSGSGSLTVAGGGLVALSGSNSYTGGTTLSNGVIQLGNSSALGAGALAVNSGTLNLAGYSPSVGALSGSAGTLITSSAGAATLSAGDASNTTFAGTISGAVGLTKTGAGSLVLAGSNSNSGATTVNGGTLVIGTAGALGTSAITVNNGALDLNGTTLTNSVAALSGTLYNGSASPAAISTTLSNSSRTFSVGGVGDISTQTITGSAGLTLNKFGNDKLTIGGSTDNAYLSLNLNGVVVVLNHTSGSSSHALGGTNPSVVNSGTLQLAGSGGNQIADAAPVTMNGGVFDLNGMSETILALSGSSGATVTNTAPSTTSTLTVTSGTTYAGSIQDGAGAMALYMTLGTTGRQILSGSNNYSGSTTLVTGTVVLANSYALLNTTLMPQASGEQVAFDSSVGSHAFSIGGLSNFAGSYIALQDNAPTPNAITLTVGGINTTSTYTGNLIGPGSLIKSGTGVFTMSGDNVYAGTTTVSSGTLAVSGSNTALSGYNVPGQVTVAAGAGLTVLAGGTNWVPTDIATLSQNVSFADGSYLGIDTTAGSITIHPSSGLVSGSATLRKLGGNTLTISGSNNYTGGTIVNNGVLSASTADGVYSDYFGSGSVTLTSAGSISLSNAALGTQSLDSPISIGSGVSTSINLGQRSQLLSPITTATDSRLNLILGTIARNYIGGNWSNFTGTLAMNDSGSTDETATFGIQAYGFNSASTVNATLDLHYASANVYVFTGGATVQVGALEGTSAGNLSGASNAAGNGTVNWQVGAKNLNTTYAGRITDGMQPTLLTKVGTGTLTLSGSNSFSGATTISNGAILLSNSDALMNSTATSIASGLRFDTGIGAFYLGGLSGSNGLVLSDTAGGAITLNVGGNNGSTTFSGVLSGGGALVKSGTGALTLSASNSYSGNTTVSGGTLQLGNASALGSGGLIVNGGTLDLHGKSVRVPDFSGAGGTITSLASGTSTLAVATSGTSTYAGAIVNGVGAVVLSESGSGALVLSGSIQMAGLNANSGSVQLTQSGSIGAVSIAAGAIVSLPAHSGSTCNVLNISSLAISGFASALSAPGATDYALMETSAQTAAQSSAVSKENTASSPTFSEASPESVPEPGSLGMLLVGALGCLGFRRATKKKA